MAYQEKKDTRPIVFAGCQAYTGSMGLRHSGGCSLRVARLGSPCYVPALAACPLCRPAGLAAVLVDSDTVGLYHSCAAAENFLCVFSCCKRGRYGWQTIM